MDLGNWPFVLIISESKLLEPVLKFKREMCKALFSSRSFLNIIIYNKCVQNQTTGKKSNLFSRLTKILREVQKNGPALKFEGCV